MEALRRPIIELGEYEKISSLLKEDGQSIALFGAADSGRLNLADGFAGNKKYRLIITADESTAIRIAEEYKLYDRNTMYYPARDIMFYEADIQGRELEIARMKAIRRLLNGSPATVVTTIETLQTCHRMPEAIKANILKLEKGGSISEDNLKRKLVLLGYENVYQVEAPGQFSVRGGLVDVFDLTEENPYRIEFWGDEIESLRSFDITSQRSIDRLGQIEIYPAAESLASEGELAAACKKIRNEGKKRVDELRDKFLTKEAHRLYSRLLPFDENPDDIRDYISLESFIPYIQKGFGSFLNYFDPEDTVLILDDAGRLADRGSAFFDSSSDSLKGRYEKGYILKEEMKICCSVKEAAKSCEDFRRIIFSTNIQKNKIFVAKHSFPIETKACAPYSNSFELLVKDLTNYKKQGYRVLLLSNSVTRAKRLATDLREYELSAVYSSDPARQVQPGEILVSNGSIRRGFIYPLIKYAVISEGDIFTETKKKKKKRFSDGIKITSFNELNIGDYVIHESYGLGIYRGIEKVEVNHTIKDYMKIEYAGESNLYVLATNFNMIQKYASADSKKPKINKLGTLEWTNTKNKVKTAVQEVARDLVELYAKRQQQNGFVFDRDNLWQKEFEELFPFEETSDQLNAIVDTKKDMESPRIMDRLICGDVGYGKTEIAIRAAFKAVQSGKQVAYLVPTTILAKQHYNNFLQRMKDFPVNVELLCRFKTAAEQKVTVTGLGKGNVDIVIGTHRILSKDVKFKDLGLLIVDEEQRFGVTHKEKIKKLKDNVDVLTLSATPIPRTLHMSLSGIRDMSLLEEAPEDRMPIQTYVCEYDEEMVREAIRRELARGGQVYYVYNFVNTIADVAAKIQHLVPDANVAFAHGKMKESELENIMSDFVSGDIDVLVSTTIIETGLDISNVNTMIIHDSDRLGLSQLYQLRGRVGRSNRNAYAFLMYRKDKLLKEVAEKRLAAIREFTDLGSGFKIAMRDLEIRGAGNILGEAQSGHMEAVGYDLYCRLLNEAVRQLKGEIVEESFETVVELETDAYIPDTYILNEIQKLDIYKRIATLESEDERLEMEKELEDRFGQIPGSVKWLLRIAILRARAHKLHLTKIIGKEERIKFLFWDKAKIRTENIPALLAKYRNDMTFDPKGTPSLEYRYHKSGIIEKDQENLLVLLEGLLGEMELKLLESLP